MGMDVYGKAARSEEGKYFRASIWTWPIIMTVLREHCEDLLGPELLRLLEYNDGAGPDDQETCSQMADRLERLLLSTDDVVVAGTCHVHCTSEEVASGRWIDRIHEEPGRFGYTTRKAILTEWIAFLRNCGGFAVL